MDDAAKNRHDLEFDMTRPSINFRDRHFHRRSGFASRRGCKQGRHFPGFLLPHAFPPPPAVALTAMETDGRRDSQKIIIVILPTASVPGTTGYPL